LHNDPKLLVEVEKSRPSRTGPDGGVQSAAEVWRKFKPSPNPGESFAQAALQVAQL